VISAKTISFHKHPRVPAQQVENCSLAIAVRASFQLAHSFEAITHSLVRSSFAKRASRRANVRRNALLFFC
jgi:hypothetical protein